MITEKTTGRLAPEIARAWEKAGIALAALGALMGAAACAVDARRFAFSYLVGFTFVVTLGLGALIFVMLQHVARAGWSVAPRRQMEWLAGFLPIGALLFIPIAILAGKLYLWIGPEAASDPLLKGKAGYLNLPAFLVRAAICFAVWAGLAWRLRKTSLAQDVSGDSALSGRMLRISAPGLLACGVTLTLAAFDWLMSLDPHWYSTIFGIYIFSGAYVSAMAVLAIGTTKLQKLGAFGKVCTVEHRHDIGKWLFAFVVFWAYIAFSQFFLIWYADLPEEIVFFTKRFEGSWMSVSVFLGVGHFAVPFVALLSRHVKRHPVGLPVVAAWVLFMHYVDLYWLVMPTLDVSGAHPTWIDLAGLLAPVGVLALWMSRRAARDPLYPIGDPRLAEAARVENP